VGVEGGGGAKVGEEAVGGGGAGQWGRQGTRADGSGGLHLFFAACDIRFSFSVLQRHTPWPPPVLHVHTRSYAGEAYAADDERHAMCHAEVR